jgi:hypothetical protein
MMEGFGTMGRKKDLKEVDAVADAFDMDDEERFGTERVKMTPSGAV